MLAASLFATVALFAPRSVKPSRLPVLVIDAEAAEAAMAKDVSRATHPPQGRWVNDLRELHAEVGLASHKATTTTHEVRARSRLAKLRTLTVRHTHGDEALWSLRAAAVVQLDEALDHEMPERARRALLGDLERQLVQYHVRSEDGAMRAPRLVAWTMFKARWNMIGSLEPTEGFEPVEEQAYFGWLALHAAGGPENKRFEAARQFERAGGHAGSEAVAVWAMRMGALGTARDALARAMAERPSVRLRNYGLLLSEAPR